MVDVSKIAGTAETIIEDVMKVEPMVAMFVPGMAVVQPFISLAAPFVERALIAIAQKNGGDAFSAFIDLLNHITPSRPNSPILSGGVAPAPDASQVGSG